jgi:flagellar hook assembly protein FlgD
LRAARLNGDNVEITKKDANGNTVIIKKISISYARIQPDKPFATNSAACAYDKKHERLYYTPMGINQLRYIDLKSKTPKIYFFEDEAFGALSSPRDIPNQITRMVMGADGNGYALTNNGAHLIRFTTGKKPSISDLGALSNDATNGISVHSESGYGGDLIAGKSGDLYLITANRRVFKIDIESRIASYKGSIQGMPKGYTTNGAIVEEGTSVIVNSSNSTEGYYRFDLNTLKAEKIANIGSVFNSSDLANANLVVERKKKKQEEVKPDILEEDIASKAKKLTDRELAIQNKIGVYPNPAAVNSFVKLAFEDQPKGRYQIQLTDISGKLISTKEVNINNRLQVHDFTLPAMITTGNYMIKVMNKGNKTVSVTQLLVQ